MGRTHLIGAASVEAAEVDITCGCPACGTRFATTASIDAGSLARQEVPDSIVTTSNRRRTGALEEGERYDVIAISVVAGRRYAVTLRGDGAAPLLDPLLGLYDRQGTMLDFDDDGGLAASSLLTFDAFATGTHYLTVQSGVVGGTGGYRAEVWAQPATDQVSDRPSEATPIRAGTTRGFIDEPGDVDTYLISMKAGKIYTIEMSGGTDYETTYTNMKIGEIDSELILRGPDGASVGFGVDIAATDFNSRLIFSPAESGAFYLDAYSATGDPGGFTLDVVERDKSEYDPLEALLWDEAALVEFGPNRTASVYFAPAGETFGERDTRGNPLVGQGWNEFEKGQVMVALDEFEKVLGTSYEITTDAAQATFRLIKAVIPQAGFFYPQDPVYGASQGIGIFNPSVNGWSTGQQESLRPGGLAFRTILHEFGHAHGLAHPHDTLGGSELLLNVTSSTDLGLFDLNQDIYTVMATANRGWQLHPDGPRDLRLNTSGWTATLSPLDIAALQKLYGRSDWATGANAYDLTDDQALASYRTIWDTGGTDTIRYRGNGDATIDLTAATLDYSPTGGGGLSWVDTPDGVYGGFILANGVVIENAISGRGDDLLVANAAPNRLVGGAGSDIVSYRHSPAAIRGGLDGVFDGGHARADRLVDIEGIEGTSFGDQIGGTDGSNHLSGLGGADLLTGRAGDDRLLGGGGDDALDGGEGDDLLDGGPGSDRLTGGLGSDRFVFDPFSGADLILDLASADLIDLGAFGTLDEVAVDLDGDGRILIDDGRDGVSDLVIAYAGERATADQFVFADVVEAFGRSVPEPMGWTGLPRLFSAYPVEAMA